MPIINLYLRDRINIISSAKDINGVNTETTVTDIKARIEDTNQVVRDQQGQEVTGNMKVIVTPLAVLTYQSKIQIITKNGLDTNTPLKKYSNRKLSIRQGLGRIGEHWEAWL